MGIITSDSLFPAMILGRSMLMIDEQLFIATRLENSWNFSIWMHGVSKTCKHYGYHSDWKRIWNEENLYIYMSVPASVAGKRITIINYKKQKKKNNLDQPAFQKKHQLKESFFFEKLIVITRCLLVSWKWQLENMVMNTGLAIYHGNDVELILCYTGNTDTIKSARRGYTFMHYEQWLRWLRIFSPPFSISSQVDCWIWMPVNELRVPQELPEFGIKA